MLQIGFNWVSLALLLFYFATNTVACTPAQGDCSLMRSGRGSRLTSYEIDAGR